MTKEETELLEEAKRRYPVGTKYRCASHGNPEEVKDKQEFKVHNTGLIHANPEKGCLMYEGRWAEIISLPKGIVPIESSPLQSLFQKLMN